MNPVVEEKKLRRASSRTMVGKAECDQGGVGRNRMHVLSSTEMIFFKMRHSFGECQKVTKEPHVQASNTCARTKTTRGLSAPHTGGSSDDCYSFENRE